VAQKKSSGVEVFYGKRIDRKVKPVKAHLKSAKDLRVYKSAGCSGLLVPNQNSLDSRLKKSRTVIGYWGNCVEDVGQVAPIGAT
jgi:hypothetical protein